MHSNAMLLDSSKASRQRGLTLMELLTVIVIIGVLASIAVPSYRSYLIRANRSDAKSALMQVQANQEKYYLQYNNYTDKVTDAPPTGLGMPGKTSHGFYEISIKAGADNQSYTATAAPVAGGGQADDKKCGSFTISDAGVRGITGGTSDSEFCWK